MVSILVIKIPGGGGSSLQEVDAKAFSVIKSASLCLLDYPEKKFHLFILYC